MRSSSREARRGDHSPFNLNRLVIIRSNINEEANCNDHLLTDSIAYHRAS
jgi:hypothetical protein